MQRIIFFSLITTILAINDRKEELSGIENYELIHFNLDRFASHSQLEFDLYGVHYKAQLVPNQNMIASQIHTTIDGDPIHDPSSKSSVSCHYFGTVLEPEQNTENSDSSYLSLSLCPNRGIRGSVTTKHETIWIMPAAYYFDAEYDRKGLHRFEDSHLVYISPEDSNDADATSQFDEDSPRVSSRHLLASNTKNVVELYVMADPAVTLRFRDDYGESQYAVQLKSEIMDLVSKASAKFKSKNWGAAGSIEIAIVEIEIVRDYSGKYQSLYPVFAFGDDYVKFMGRKNCQDWRKYQASGQGGCIIQGNANGDDRPKSYISKFTQWKKEYKGHKNYDHHLLLAGNQMAAAGGAGLGGVAWLGGMCLNGWNTLVIAFKHRMFDKEMKTLCHELGHNLGMSHNSVCQNCPLGKRKDSNWQFASQGYNELNKRFTERNKLQCLIGRQHASVSGGGGGSNNNNNNNNGGGTCCECSDSPSKWKCNQDCEDAVMAVDAYCGSHDWDGTCVNIAKKKCPSGGGGGGGSNPNPTPKPTSKPASGTCCECDSFPSKTNCNWACENAVKYTDPWCEKNDWDDDCKKIAKNKCGASESIHEWSNTMECLEIKGVNQISNGEWHPNGMVDGITSYKIDGDRPWYLYRTKENGQQVWTMHHDRNNVNYVNSNYKCFETFITQCTGNWYVGNQRMYDSKIGECGSFRMEGLECLEDNAYGDNVCVYNEGSLWNDEENRKQFEIISDECLNGKPMYQYVNNDDISYQLYYKESREYVDSVYRSGQWIISLNGLSSDIIAQCDESDLSQCAKGQWRVLYETDDSLGMIVDETMNICSSPSAKKVNNHKTAFIVAGLVLLLFIIVLFIIIIYRYRSKKLKMEKNVEFTQKSVVEDESEDDEEEIDVEVDGERETAQIISN